jgi:hypothetical protein
MASMETTSGGAPMSERIRQTPGDAFDRAALGFMKREAALSGLPRSLVSLVSLNEERTLTLRGKVLQIPPGVLCRFVEEAIASAAPVSGDAGQLEEIWGGRGWVVAWSRRAGYAAVIAQQIGSPGDAETFRATAQRLVSELGFPVVH